MPERRGIVSHLFLHHYRNGRIMDRASQVLTRDIPSSIPRSYRALADHGNVPHSTLHHCARGRPSMEEKAQGQQYLRPYEEDVIVNYPPSTYHRQTPQASRTELNKGSRETPSRTHSTKSQSIGLEPSREKYL
ncbi:hypothetical protein BOTCAL_1467g00010 [Botryotinia calthae]|uniref:Uncharacterized protein n=1 Tax=Botryotinia calthae TaxID=38488 RepID=A0A4Y8CCD1_9HELO|nr:hypothetical protein BOTCAL_1467g00010 [Botryotinia calthae]